MTRESVLDRVMAHLRDDPRLVGDEVELTGRGSLFEIRHRSALVVVCGGEGWVEELLSDYAQRLADGHAALLVVGAMPPGTLEQMHHRVALQVLEADCSDDALYTAVHGLLERVELRLHGEGKARRLERYRYELGELVEIARALSQERDIERLLGLILEKSRSISGADAGSIYVVEGQDPDVTKRTLRFKLSQNESCAFESSEFTIPVSTRSIAGAAVITRRPINIEDVYAIPEETPYGFDRSFDAKVGYRTRSMIAAPMISAEDEVIGVIQLINKKRDPSRRLTSPADCEQEVVPFGERGEELLQTLASQAGIALENALLYDEIKNIFEGFVRASVQAIEQRDPTTSGHSLRVSVLSCDLAEVVDRSASGVFEDVRFSRKQIKELEYASLLHDFGKIGVREQVLVKAKKLYPHELNAIRARFDYLLEAAEVEMLERRVALMEQGAGAAQLADLDLDLVRRRGELLGAMQVILQANEPTVLNEGDFTRIGELVQLRYDGRRGGPGQLLTEHEAASLQVTRGSLNRGEIDEIRSHVTHTFDFLSRIPWGKTMSEIPRIAGAHHEKLDGSGYPHGIRSEDIPLQSKIMTVADIFDALTARDRPYKKAMPVARALDILALEVRDGHIDADLVQLFTAAKLYEHTQRDLVY